MVTIQEVSRKADIKKFIAFANDLYRDNPYYVPDMFDSQVADFDRAKNPAYEYCDTKCFLAYRDGKIAGRIAGILNTHANEKYGQKRLRFSHADYIDDAEVVDALFGAVEAWARALGCGAVHGPLGFCDMDREGLLVEGFDRMSQFFVYYNHPYYMAHMERMGYQKDVDWIEYLVTLPKEPEPRLSRLAAAVARRQKLVIADLTDRKSIRPYVRGIFELYNDTYATLYGTVPLTPAQVDKYVGEFLPLVNGRTTCVLLNNENRVVAFGVGAPSLARAQQKSRGRMLPLGWYHVLKALNGKNDVLDMFLIAVKPSLQGAGVNAVILDHLLKNAIEDGRKFAETGPELEENTKVQSQWKFFETEQHKRRRCYVKEV